MIKGALVERVKWWVMWELRYKAFLNVTEIKTTGYICLGLNLWATDSFCLGRELKKHPQ